MAELDLKYYNGVDEYSDGDIEEDIFDIVKNGGMMSEEEKRYAVLYHLSPIRENILNWYPFRAHSRVLEIGAGCGAITGLLCRKAETVVSVELSKRRASINFSRHKDYNNLHIYVGNLNEMDFQEPFDYVVLNGVLEYAMSFTKGENPYIDFLKRVKGYLKQDGIVLIAIENRLGLRYFSGYPEEHTNTEFLGLRAYEGNHQVRTFSKTEFKNLLEESGFEYQKFYYPYPDYKFPNEIFTDAYLNGYGKPYLNLCKNRYQVFEEYKMAPLFEREGVAGCFSNSFLVEASGEKKEENSFYYAKMNMDRFPRFCTATVVEKDCVKKVPLTEDAKLHLKKLAENTKEAGSAKIQYVGLTEKEDAVYMPFVSGKSLDYEIEQLIGAGKGEEALALATAFFDTYLESEKLEQRSSQEYHTKEFADVFGEVRAQKKLFCVRNANVDLIMDNIFRKENDYTIIDGEWIFAFEIPVLFIEWRSLNELYSRHHKLGELITRADAMHRFQIDEELESVFWHWATYFVKNYIGGGQLERFVEPIKWLDIRAAKSPGMGGSLYIDAGNGYSEENKMYIEYMPEKDGSFSFVYCLKNVSDVKNLRWDPVEGKACLCSVRACCGEKELRVEPVNEMTRVEGKDVFLTMDPQYKLLFSKLDGKQIRIEGNIHFLTQEEMADQLQRLPKEKNCVRASVCFDTNNENGFTDNICLKTYQENGRYEFEYPLSGIENLKALRWRIEEKAPCICKIQAFSGCKEIFPRCVGENARTESGDVLLNENAFYEIPVKKLRDNSLKICAEIHFLRVQEAVEFVQNHLEISVQRYRWLAEEQKKICETTVQENRSEVTNAVEGELERLRAEKNVLLQQLHNMEQTRGWRTLEKIRKIKHKLFRK